MYIYMYNSAQAECDARSIFQAEFRFEFRVSLLQD